MSPQASEPPQHKHEVVYRAPASLKADPRNSRVHPPEQIEQFWQAYLAFGWTRPLFIRPNGVIGVGNGWWQMAVAKGIAKVPIITLHGLSEDQWRALAIADNKLALNAVWDEAILRAELVALQSADFKIDVTGFSLPELRSLGVPLGAMDGSPGSPQQPPVSLADRFGVVPFSVLNAREGWWQARKQAWLALGIQSELGRGDNLLKMSDTVLEPDPAKRAAMRAAREKVKKADAKA